MMFYFKFGHGFFLRSCGCHPTSRTSDGHLGLDHGITSYEDFISSWRTQLATSCTIFGFPKDDLILWLGFKPLPLCGGYRCSATNVSRKDTRTKVCRKRLNLCSAVESVAQAPNGLSNAVSSP